METKTIKNSDKETCRKFWKEIFERKKNLSDQEAEDMMKIIENSRKEKGFRD